MTAAAPAIPKTAGPAPAVFAMLGAMISNQVGTSFAKSLFPVVGSMGATTLRVAIAAVILLAWLRPWRQPPTRQAWPVLIAYGSVLGVMNLCFYLALRTIPLGVGVAIEFVGPLSVAVLSSRRASHLVWIALAAAGLGSLLPIWRQSNPLDPGGIALMLAAGACWAAYIVFGQRAGRAQGRGATAIGMAIAAVAVLPFGVASAGVRLLSPAVLAPGFAVALLASAIPYSLEMVALTRLPVRVFGTLQSLSPAVAALMGWLILREALSPLQGLAIAAIVAASMGTTASLAVADGKRRAEIEP